jgi:putative NADPH-quinone reductase
MTDAINHTEVQGMFTFCGIRKSQHVVFYNVMMADDKTRRKYLEEARELGKKF